ncbi:NADH-quinone oxidoreductase subunit J [Arthrobacter sp. DNA4]|uniref:NADH-quinone oxidoreductase subunit J n=1 Tax=Arthrobacter sp. DNA4 TaxID=2963432 RepID=UPI0020CB7D27|nr:NADH-quinone oxidoreductase subunit J [Arthrobacter sp. DNA4]UTT68999.1 NADH-quinone oxidoreductase subunit J [Arthrobacter sp. DNA4]
MNQQSFGQRTAPDTEAGSGGSGSAAVGPGHPTAAGDAAKGQAAGRNAASGKIDPNANHAVLGPFTVRDLAVFAGTLILFVASLLPLFGARYNLWNLNNLFFLGLGIILPLIASALFAARRLAPATRIRVGSLSIDQFASVVASFAVAFFFLSVASGYGTTLLVGLIGSLVLFAATVLGRFLPYLSGDFKDRPEMPAHVVAREAAVPARKPRAPKAPKPESSSNQSKGGFKGAGIFGGAGAGSSAVQPGSAGHSPEPVRSAQPPATAAVPVAPAGASNAGVSNAGAASPAAATAGTGSAAAATPGAATAGSGDTQGSAGAAAAGAGTGAAGRRRPRPCRPRPKLPTVPPPPSTPARPPRQPTSSALPLLPLRRRPSTGMSPQLTPPRRRGSRRLPPPFTSRSAPTSPSGQRWTRQAATTRWTGSRSTRPFGLPLPSTAPPSTPAPVPPRS